MRDCVQHARTARLPLPVGVSVATSKPFELTGVLQQLGRPQTRAQVAGGADLERNLRFLPPAAENRGRAWRSGPPLTWNETCGCMAMRWSAQTPDEPGMRGASGVDRGDHAASCLAQLDHRRIFERRVEGAEFLPPSQAARPCPRKLLEVPLFGRPAPTITRSSTDPHASRTVGLETLPWRCHGHSALTSQQDLFGGGTRTSDAEIDVVVRVRRARSFRGKLGPCAAAGCSSPKVMWTWELIRP